MLRAVGQKWHERMPHLQMADRARLARLHRAALFTRFAHGGRARAVRPRVALLERRDEARRTRPGSITAHAIEPFVVCHERGPRHLRPHSRHAHRGRLTEGGAQSEPLLAAALSGARRAQGSPRRAEHQGRADEPSSSSVHASQIYSPQRDSEPSKNAGSIQGAFSSQAPDR